MIERETRELWYAVRKHASGNYRLDVFCGNGKAERRVVLLTREEARMFLRFPEALRDLAEKVHRHPDRFARRTIACIHYENAGAFDILAGASP